MGLNPPDERPLHPQMDELEAHHFGHALPEVGRHLPTCAACRAAVDALGSAEADFQALYLGSDRKLDDLIRRARMPLEEASKQVRWWRLGGPVGLTLTGALATAALTLVVQPWGPEPANPGRGASRTTNAGDVALPELVAKGTATMTLIRERNAVQAYLQGSEATVAPGDRLRLRFFVKRKENVSAGILTDAGEWVPFFEGPLAAGMHTPTATLAVDSEPSSGRVLVGASERVDEAKQGGEVAMDLQVMRLVWQRTQASRGLLCKNRSRMADI